MFIKHYCLINYCNLKRKYCIYYLLYFQLELCNQIVDGNKILKEENVLLSNQLKELQDLDVKKTAEIAILKDDMSGMQSLIDQKSAEV